jgi:hypothetical protein
MWWFIAKTLLKLYIADSVLEKTTDLIWGGRQNAIYWLDDQMRELNKIYHQNKLSYY